MSSVQSVYLVASALCLFSTGILHGKLRRRARAPSYFAIYLLLEAMCFLFELLIAYPQAPLKALWLGLLMASSLLIAPILWLAVKERVDHERPPLSALGLRERAVIALGSILTLPLIETTHLGTTFENPLRSAPTLLEPLIHETMLACIALFALQVPLYVWRCQQALRHANRRKESREHRWLQVPLAIVCTTWLLGVVRTLTAALSEGNALFHVSVAFIDVTVTVACVFVIVSRIAAETDPAPGAEHKRQTAQQKYARSQLDPAVRRRILRKLDDAFVSDAIYRDSALNLALLSEHLRESEHYVSQVINQDLDTSFYDLVNARRIEHAMVLLLNAPQRTVLEIALEVGFNAKSTFNSAFKRHTGMTPSSYRAAGELKLSGNS